MTRCRRRHTIHIPIGSMGRTVYFTYIWVVFLWEMMVNVKMYIMPRMDPMGIGHVDMLLWYFQTSSTSWIWQMLQLWLNSTTPWSRGHHISKGKLVSSIDGGKKTKTTSFKIKLFSLCFQDLRWRNDGYDRWPHLLWKLHLLPKVPNWGIRLTTPKVQVIVPSLFSLPEGWHFKPLGGFPRLKVNRQKTGVLFFKSFLSRLFPSIRLIYIYIYIHKTSGEWKQYCQEYISSWRT